MEDNKGFSFYQNYWESIKQLPVQQQQEVCWAIVKYGITGECVDAAQYPLGFSFATAFKMAIDNSTNKFNNAATNGSKGGRNSIVDSERLTTLIKMGKSAAECAKELNVSVDTIYKRKEWKERKSLV